MADRFWELATRDDPADLRDEFNSLIDGEGGFQGVGQVHVHRKLTTEFCVCYDPVEGSSSDCKYCKGETYTYTEVYVRAYFTQTFGRSLTGARQSHILRDPGYFDHGKALVYMKFDADPKPGDIIFRIRLNEEGSIYYPIERTEKWKITGVEDKRYDRARLAYFICLCEREEA